MTAKIGLEDVRIHAPHGFFEEEHLMGNEFSIDVEVEAGITSAAHDDDLGGTVNYATIYYLIHAEMKKPTQLLEALAYRMGNRIMDQFDSVTSVKLRLRKLNPPLGGKVGAAVVEVSLGSPGGGGGSMYGRPAKRRPDTFEDLERGGGERDRFGRSGGFDAGGFGGGGLGRGRGAQFYPPAPEPGPPPAFDLSSLDGDVSDGVLDRKMFERNDDLEVPEEELLDEEGAHEEKPYEEGEYDLGDMDPGEINLSGDGFDFGDMGPGGYEGIDLSDPD